MTNDPAGFAKYTRDLRTLGPWAPLSAVGIVFLLIGVDITLGRAGDPPFIGHTYLTLFGLGLVATLAVRGRRQRMRAVCLGLAAVEVGLVTLYYLRGLISLTTPMLIITGLTVGGLCTAAVMFGRADSGEASPHTH